MKKKLSILCGVGIIVSLFIMIYRIIYHVESISLHFEEQSLSYKDIILISSIPYIIIIFILLFILVYSNIKRDNYEK